jgi:hypothetical protein
VDVLRQATVPVLFVRAPVSDNHLDGQQAAAQSA